MNLSQYCFCVLCFGFWPQGRWRLSSRTRDGTCTPCIGRGSLNHWTTRQVPGVLRFVGMSISSPQKWISSAPFSVFYFLGWPCVLENKTECVYFSGCPSGTSGKDLPAGAGDTRDAGLMGLWVWKVPWRRTWQPPPVFSPGGSLGQRGLAGCRPGARQESGTIK